MAETDTGGVRPEEIAAFVAEEGLPPTAAGASLATRFVRKIAELVSARAGAGENGQFSVFLLSESLFDDVRDRSCEEVPLLSNGQDPISDRVWISTARLGTAFACSIPWTDQSTLYQAIRDAGLGDFPALVIDWRPSTPLGSLYVGGLNRPDEQDRVVFDSSPIHPDELRGTIHRFWEKSLRTPGQSVEGHAMKVWETAHKGVPAPRPEERIHGRLMEALKARFARHDMRAEPATDDGRIDILIWSMTVGAGGETVQRNEWVIELKALTDKTSNGNPVASSVVESALRGGLEQAVAYQSRTYALRAALCCFDMRKDDVGDPAAFACISSDADTYSIELWRWYLYRSAAAARKAALSISA